MKPQLTLLAIALSWAALPASAAVLVLNPTADTFVRGGTTNPGAQTVNSGSATQLLVGSVAGGDSARSIFSFSLNDPLLVGATINSVTLTFTIDGGDGTSTANSVSFSLHQLTQNYNASQATWEIASTGTNWIGYSGSPAFTGGGGVFNPAALSTFNAVPTSLAAGNTVGFGTSVALTSLVTSSIGGTLDLLVKQTTESATRNLIRLASLESTDIARRPVLAIDYTPIPEPASATALFGLVTLGFVAVRRRQRHA